MTRFSLSTSIIFVFTLLVVMPTFADELEVSPFKGSSLVGEHNSRFSSLPILIEPLEEGVPTKVDLEGSLNSRIFERPEEVSSLEVLRSYSNALASDGFEILLACEHQKGNCWRPKVTISKTYADLFRSRDYGKIRHDTGMWLLMYANHFLTAKKQTTEGVLYVVVIVSDKKNLYMIDSLKVDVMEENTVEITTKMLDDKIATTGRVVLSGIFFETGKNIITEKSKPALTTIAEYLNNHPDQSFYVVGHTDDTGDLDNNVVLSRKRAQAVVEALTASGVDSERLTSHGVGPFSPTATNESENGRADNRRVELVLRLN